MAEFCSAHSNTISPLQWTSFAPPLTPVPEKPLRDLALEALSKLGVEVAPSRYEMAYNSGQTTQVPTGRVIGVKGRVSRKISYNGRSITFEKV